jgi:hypothetical protein
MGGGRSYDLDACGRLGRRDERARKALRYTPRSLVSAPAVYHSVSRWRRPAAGWGGHTDLLCGRTNVRENFGERQLLKGKRMLTRGVKIISAQITWALTTSSEGTHKEVASLAR